MRDLALILSLALSALAAPGLTADLPASPPPLPATEAPPSEGGVWGAIATAPADGRYGMFWGGADRAEAEANALAHCRNRGGTECGLATVFRNTGASLGPREAPAGDRCGALATPEAGVAGRWAALSGPSRVEAEANALEACGGPGLCRIREWVCT